MLVAAAALAACEGTVGTVEDSGTASTSTTGTASTSGAGGDAVSGTQTAAGTDGLRNGHVRHRAPAPAR